MIVHHCTYSFLSLVPLYQLATLHMSTNRVQSIDPYYLQHPLLVRSRKFVILLQYMVIKHKQIHTYVLSSSPYHCTHYIIALTVTILGIPSGCSVPSRPTSIYHHYFLLSLPPTTIIIVDRTHYQHDNTTTPVILLRIHHYNNTITFPTTTRRYHLLKTDNTPSCQCHYITMGTHRLYALIDGQQTRLIIHMQS